MSTAYADLAGYAVDFTRMGRRVLPLPFQSKIPTQDDWSTLRIEERDVSRFFPKNVQQNLGLLNGEPSRGLIDIDHDCREAVEAGTHFLPRSTWMSGRPSNPNSHAWFTVEAKIETATFADTDGKMIVELRSTGTQTVVPPSIHPDGEQYIWHRREGEPTKVDAEELNRAVRLTAAAAIIAKHWPAKGSRQAASLALAGALLRAGWEVDAAESFMTAVVDAAGDEEGRGRVRNVRSAAERQDNEQKTKGWTSLKELLVGDGAKVVRFVQEWLGITKGKAGESQADQPWPEPILLSEVPAVPEFPAHVFPDELAGYVKELAWTLNAPIDFVGVAVLALAAGAIGNSRRLRLSATHYQPALIYAGMVGLPGTTKSPVLKHLTVPFDIIQKAYNEAYESEMEQWKKEQADRKAAKAEGLPLEQERPKPQLKLIIARNATTESIGLVLHHNPRGIVLPFDELAGLFAGMNQYKAGGAGSDRQFFLSAWAQETLNALRKHDLANGIPPLFVVNPCISLVGGIQPDLLASIRGQGSHRGAAPPNDGGIDRFLLAWPRTLPDIYDEGRDMNPDLLSVWPTIVNKLIDDLGDTSIVGMTFDAKKAWNDFLRVHASEVNDPDFPEHLRGPWSKMKAYCARLTLVLHTLRWAAGEGTILDDVPPDTVNRAVELVTYFKAHCRKVHTCMESDPRIGLARKVMKWVVQGKLDRFTRRDAYRLCRGTMKTVDDFDPILALLESHNLIRPETAERHGRGRSSPAYLVNPAVHGRESDEDDRQGPEGDEPQTLKPSTPGQYGQNGQNSPANGQDEAVEPIFVHSVPFVQWSRGLEIEPEDPEEKQAGGRSAGQNGQMGQNSQPSGTHTPEQMEGLTLVDTPGMLASVRSALSDAPGERVYIDLETTGLDHRTDRTRLISLSIPAGEGRATYLIDCFRVDPSPIFEALAECELVGHNLAFDLGFLSRIGFRPGKVRDTILLSQALYASAHTKGVARVKHGLKDCLQREVGIQVDKDLQKSNWSGILSPEQLAYAAADVEHLGKLNEALSRKLAEAGLERVATLECEALPCLTWMATSGVPFDRAKWKELADTAKADVIRVTSELEAAAPKRMVGLFEGKWDWNSLNDVKEALALAGHAVESTGDEILAKIDHPLANLLRDFRDARKRETTYGSEWAKKHVGPDDRIYPHWAQMGANSGRMACGDPNMQNLPRGEYRKCFAAPAGRLLVKADYSQIELRIAAKVSNDETLLAAYQRGDDLHTLTAKNVLGIQEVTKRDRQTAKSLNFGLLYGMGSKTFKDYARTTYGVELTDAQAEKYRNAFFNTYTGLKRWHRSMPEKAIDTRTLMGRRVLRVDRFSEKLNLPVQGSGADGLKEALALLHKRRDQIPTAFPILAVHDEIVAECDEADAARAAEWVKQAMLDAMTPLIWPVPVEVEVKIGKTWGGD